MESEGGAEGGAGGGGNGGCFRLPDFSAGISETVLPPEPCAKARRFASGPAACPEEATPEDEADSPGTKEGFLWRFHLWC